MWTSPKLGVILDFAGNLVMAGAIWAWFYELSAGVLTGWHTKVDNAAQVGEKWRDLKKQFSRTPRLSGLEGAAHSKLPVRFTIGRLFAPVRLFFLKAARLILATVLSALRTVFVGKLQAPLFLVGLAMWCWASYIDYVNTPW